MASLHKSGKYWYIHGRYNGKQFKVSTKTASRQMAERAKRRVEDDICAGRFSLEKLKRDDHYLNDFFELYIKKSEGEKSPNTIKRDQVVFKNFQSFGGNMTVEEITPAFIENYKRYLRDERGFKPTTINIELRHLKATFSYAVERDFISENPFRRVKLMKVEKLKPRYLTKEQAEKLLDFTEGWPIYHFILTALNTGARLNEIVKLKWENVDFTNKHIKVLGKGSKERFIPVRDSYLEYLKGLERKDEFVSPRLRGKSHISATFKSFAVECGLVDFRFHDLRHTYASWMAQRDMPILVLKDIMGHEDIQTTMRYAHTAPENSLQAVRILDEKIGGK